MRKLLTFVFSFLFLTLIFKPSVVFAEYISSFSSEITAYQNGSFDVSETIVYDFENEYRHGIFRTIPLTSKVGDLYQTINITLNDISVDGQSSNYFIESTGGEFKVRIGDADKTITGEHTYIISYNVENGTRNYKDHDEIYWNVTGNDWEIPINKASAVLNTDFSVNPDKYTCFTGVLGSTDKNCSVISSNPLRIETSLGLGSGEGLTIVAGFPVNTFPASVLSDKAPGSFDPESAKYFFILVALLLVFTNILLPVFLIVWYLSRKSKKRFGAPVANFDIPKDKNGKRILPAEAGTIDTSYLDQNDVVGTIFDLAIRKFIKLEEAEKKKFLGLSKSKTVSIIKLKDYDLSNVNNYEKILLDRLFKDGNKVELDDLKSDFYKTFKEMETEIFNDHVGKSFYIKNPKNQRMVLTALGFISIFLGGFSLAVILFWLSRALNGRTETGDEIDWKIDGLKLFLKSMDRNYKWQAKQLYIVEQMIPYAIALGYIDKFMEQLKIIKPDYHPAWYSGRSSFYTFFPNISSSMNSSLRTTAPGSSSGFSGGGSSGGGGGGGGGGSW